MASHRRPFVSAGGSLSVPTLAVVYAAVWGTALLGSGADTPPVWLHAGVLFGALVAAPRPLRSSVLLAIVVTVAHSAVAMGISGGAWTPHVVTGGAVAMSSALTAHLARRFVEQPDLRRVASLAWLALFGVVVLPVVTLGCLVLFPFSNSAAAAGFILAGLASGVAVGAPPLLLYLSSDGVVPSGGWRRFEAVTLLAAVALCAELFFGGRIPLLAMVVVPALVAVARFDVAGAVCAWSVVVSVGMMHGSRLPIVGAATMLGTVHRVQTMSLTGAACLLLMAAVWRERNDLVFRLREAAAGLEDMVARRSDELRKSELRLRQAIDVAGLGVFEHDYDNDVVFVSPRMQELAGRHGDGPLALAESLDAVHPDDRARVIASIERSMHPETGGTDTEYRVQWPDGTVRWHRSRAQTFFEGSRPRRTVGVVMDITPQKVEQVAWRETHEGLEKRIESRTAALAEARLASQAALVDAPVSSHGEPAVGRLIEAQDAERRRLSREVHDQLGGHVATLGILASAVQGHAHGGEASAAASALAEAVAHLGEDVGRLARELRPAIVDSLGLAAALRHQVEEWGRRTSVPVAFEAIGGDGAGAPVDVEATLYRVTQEALTNVARHAAATRVAVVLTVRNGQLSLVVEDDGCGFCPGEAASTGLGLVGMRERLALVRGTLQVESAPGRGTTVHARVPVSLDRNPGPELRV